MLEMLQTRDDVLALRIAHTIVSDELEPALDRLDAAMAAHPKVHVFIDCHAIDGIEIAGMGHYWRRAWPLLMKLDRFGRVAVVADQAWLRLATRIESALLPRITYRTFTPDQRDAAFAWVTGLESGAP